MLKSFSIADVNPSMRLWLNLGHFDNICINAVGSSFKSTIITPIAILSAGLALWTTMTVHALCIVTFQSKATWGHASNGGQDEIIILGQLARVIMVTVVVGTVSL